MRARGTRGMSYIELLVALTIVSIVLVVSGALLVRLSRQAEEQSRRPVAVGGKTDLALEQLERDVRQAAAIASGENESGVRVLILDMSDGERVVWLAPGSSLVRARTPLGGETFTRDVAADVSLVEWTRRSPHVMDLRLRRKDENLRQRTVLLRNVDRVPSGT